MRCGELRQARALRFGQRLQRGLGARHQARAVRQTNMLRREAFPFGRPQRELLQLGDLFFELQALGLALRELLLYLGGERFEPPPRAIPSTTMKPIGGVRV